MLICMMLEARRDSGARMRSAVSRYPLVIMPAIMPLLADVGDDLVELRMQQRLAAAHRDDGGAELRQASRGAGAW